MKDGCIGMFFSVSLPFHLAADSHSRFSTYILLEANRIIRCKVSQTFTLSAEMHICLILVDLASNV